jgi:hypothetical protein
MWRDFDTHDALSVNAKAGERQRKYPPEPKARQYWDTFGPENEKKESGLHILQPSLQQEGCEAASWHGLAARVRILRVHAAYGGQKADGVRHSPAHGPGKRVLGLRLPTLGFFNFRF